MWIDVLCTYSRVAEAADCPVNIMMAICDRPRRSRIRPGRLAGAGKILQRESSTVGSWTGEQFSRRAA